MILDRDGTLIKHVPYLSDPQQVELLPGVREGLQRLRDAGCRLFLHTNQSGVGRGKFSIDAVEACNAAMIRLIDLGASPFERICIASESPDGELGYRKPSPRFGEELIAANGFARDELCQVGDNLPDMLTARNLGIHGVGLTTGLHDIEALLRDAGFLPEYPLFGSFLDAAEHIVMREAARA